MSICTEKLPEDHVARTLTCDVKIALVPGSQATLVSDCGFLQANQAAEELYGSPLGYRYKSEFRRKEDTLIAQCRAVASASGVARDWNASTLNYLVRADGEGLWVRQEVTTYRERSITYWLTALTVSSQPGDLPTCTPSDFGLTFDEVQAVCGRFTIADIQALPQNLTPALQLSTIIPGELNICKISGQSTVKVGPIGAFLERFLHCCQRCGLIWGSHKRRPKNCARRGQVSGDTGCGTLEWWREGEAS